MRPFHGVNQVHNHHQACRRFTKCEEEPKQNATITLRERLKPVEDSQFNWFRKNEADQEHQAVKSG